MLIELSHQVMLLNLKKAHTLRNAYLKKLFNTNDDNDILFHAYS